MTFKAGSWTNIATDGIFDVVATGTTPVLALVTPIVGTIDGGTQIAIYGVNFGASQGIGTVTLDGNTVTIISWSDTLILGTTPAGSDGAVTLSVTNNDSNSATGTFTYQTTGGGGTGTTGVTGPDNRSGSALNLTAAQDYGTVTIDEGSVLIWHTAAIALTIGGVTISLTAHDTFVLGSDTWSLSYATGITGTGALVVTPTTTSKVFDIRGYNSEIDTETLDYLFTDVTAREGRNLLPRF